MRSNITHKNNNKTKLEQIKQNKNKKKTFRGGNRVSVAVSLGSNGKGNERHKNMFFGGPRGSRLLFQVHSPGGAMGKDIGSFNN